VISNTELVGPDSSQSNGVAQRRSASITLPSSDEADSRKFSDDDDDDDSDASIKARYSATIRFSALGGTPRWIAFVSFAPKLGLRFRASLSGVCFALCQRSVIACTVAELQGVKSFLVESDLFIRLRKSNCVIFNIALPSYESPLVPVEMIQFLLKLILKQISCCALRFPLIAGCY